MKKGRKQIIECIDYQGCNNEEQEKKLSGL